MARQKSWLYCFVRSSLIRYHQDASSSNYATSNRFLLFSQDIKMACCNYLSYINKCIKIKSENKLKIMSESNKM